MKANADGHCPIWLRFSDANRTLYASLGVYVHPRFWNERKSEVRKGHPHAKRINALIQRRLAEAEDERLRLLMDREPVTAEALKAVVANEPSAGVAACFLRYARAFVSELEARGEVGPLQAGEHGAEQAGGVHRNAAPVRQADAGVTEAVRDASLDGRGQTRLPRCRAT